MAPKGGNARKENGRAKKAENKAKKQEAIATAKEKKEAEEWSKGAKSTKVADDKAAKKAAEAARKAENARLLAEEEARTASAKKAAPKAGKGEAKPPPSMTAGPGAPVAGGGLASGPAALDSPPKPGIDEPHLMESFAATGIDDALDLLDVVNAKTDKASVGQQAAGMIEKHPERRFKAALEAYRERELPRLRAEDLLYKMFQKSPDNPHNRIVVAYNATKEEKVEALAKHKKELEERLREAH
ncbi:unnamed protein product [Rhizoctonia solani]|uniref:DUF1014-domain-containing protein n=1 Tax=Rhizoctonia solani TaxID=456999 RepID=A0A8H3HU89_9AGAM|nr:unnamed protein product [Rhizoctonia solani]